MRVRRMEEVVRILEQSHASTVLSRHLYWRCYPLLGARKADDNLVII